MSKIGIVTVVIVYGVVVSLFVIGFGDIVGGLVDNHVGLVTGDAIRAVKALPNGKGTIGSAVAQRKDQPHWGAEHADDDSLFSVRVSANEAQWCVAYTIAANPLPHMKITDIAPANRSAQALSGPLASRYSALPDNSSWECSAIRMYFRKSSPEALFHQQPVPSP